MSLDKSIERYIILVILMLAAAASGMRALGADAETTALWNAGMKHLSDNNPAKAEECGRKLRKNDRDAEAMLYSDIILSQAALIKGEYRTAYSHLRAAESSIDKSTNDSIKGSVYNGLGLYELNAENNLNKALEYFFAALDNAKKANYQGLYAIILNNIVETYYLKNDSSGLEYALECLEIGKRGTNPMLMYAGTIETARMYLLKGDLENASRYAAEALEIATREESLNYVSEACLTMGETEIRKKACDAALKHFTQAEKNAGEKQDVRIRAIYGSALALKGMGLYNESIARLVKALELSDAAGISLHRSDILLAISELYELRGNMKEALEYHRLYSKSLDSLSKEQNEKYLQEARAKFDLERKDNELNVQKMNNLRRQRTTYVLFGLLVIALGIATALQVMAQKKNKFYRVIVSQNKQAMLLEGELRQRIKALEGELAAKESATAEKTETRYISSSLSEDKSRELLLKLEQTMQSEQAFKNPELTKERLAAMLQTNRSYLSRIINEHYNQTFTQYVNSLRIREAVRILSDREREVVLKQLCADLGFTSMSTFYAQFKESTGMTPVVYRKQALASEKKMQ